jgi:CMP-N-acetylneuraminic acid synthetase
MKICGIILAKENSNRFPGKNYHRVDGKPMFMHGVNLMTKFIDLSRIYVATNSSKIFEKSIKIGCIPICRSVNAIHDEQPYLDVLRTVYMQIESSYDLIITVLANSIYHNPKKLKEALNLIASDEKINEVRTFNENGTQTGVSIFRESFLLNFNTTIHEMGAVIDTGKEIHYREELENGRAGMD